MTEIILLCENITRECEARTEALERAFAPLLSTCAYIEKECELNAEHAARKAQIASVCARRFDAGRVRLPLR